MPTLQLAGNNADVEAIYRPTGKRIRTLPPENGGITFV